MSFIPLHIETAFSLLNSTLTIEKLLASAEQNGFRAIGVADEHTLYSLLSLYEQAHDRQVKPIIGVQLDIQLEEERDRVIVWAENNQGYQQLLKLSSMMMTQEEGAIPLKWLHACREGLIVAVGVEGSALQQRIWQGDGARWLALYRQQFARQQLYVALPWMNEAEMTAYAEVAEQTETPLVALPAIRYADEQERLAYHCLRHLKNGEKWQGQTDDVPHHFFTINEVLQQYAAYPEAVTATREIEARCDVTIVLGQQKLPSARIEHANDELRRQAAAGLVARQLTSAAYSERLEYELQVIERMGFADYFLIVADFIRYAHEQHILVGPGRGSACGSLVSYALRITDVDPLQYDLLFERFLNPDRVTMPDIDIDFPDHRRDEVIRYVQQKYGEKYVAQIGTLGTFGPKAAMRDMARVFHIELPEVDAVAKLIPSKPGTTLRDAFEQSAAFRERVERDERLMRAFSVALQVEGLPRHTSIHAAGVVLTNEPLVHDVALQAGHDGMYITQFTMDQLEKLGLLKMDFLGLRNLSMIEAMVKAIRLQEPTFDLTHIPFDDEATYQLLSEGDTLGIFQLESEGMRDVLRKLQPSTFEDIVAINALYRPGPMDYIPTYIDNRRRGQFDVPHDDLRPILARTHGVLVYQEQIMQVASLMAGYTLGQADLLRRAVSKKKREVLDEQRKSFVQGAQQKGYALEVADEVYDWIVKFANYGFNRSHAVAYSVISYQLAYLKANYPHVFLATMLSQSTQTEARMSQYRQACRKRGIQLLPPSINKSGYSFTVERGDIRCGLAAIKHVNQQALKAIFAARKDESFRHFFDFCARVRDKAVNRKVIEALIHAGTFDEWGKERATLLATIDVALDHAELMAGDDLMGQFEPKYVGAEPLPPLEQLAEEKAVLGFYLSDHPVQAYALVRERLQAVALEEIVDQRTAIALVAAVRTLRTKKGEPMAFVTLSDEQGEREAACFPQTYRTAELLLRVGAIVVIEAVKDEQSRKGQLILRKVEALAPYVTESERELFIKVTAEHHTSEKLRQLQTWLLRERGTVGVTLYFEQEKRALKLAGQYSLSSASPLLEKIKKMFGSDNIIIR